MKKPGIRPGSPRIGSLKRAIHSKFRAYPMEAGSRNLSVWRMES
ncbi:hypothetical protein RTCIAT899_PC04285 (plasmid) [Rhizobium tropici CIAT 899]|nr:hypothetical protein RTCIAT899_PC04285 [Rhizobium tropici CIAT 899]